MKLPGFWIRPAPSPPPTAAPPQVTAGCTIQDFFVFRHVLFVRGCIEHRGAPPRLHLRHADGSVHPVAAQTDEFNASDATRWCFHFHHPLPPAATAEEIAALTLIFAFPEGDFERRDPTAAGIAADPFLNSERDYWAAVRASSRAEVLEIGSRARSGITRRHLFPADCRYTGFDILAGENVDVVGDAHALSRCLPRDHFDFVFSVSVWEHLAMPWLVSLELNRVMKTGGLAMINTHQSWPVHEEPWDYFRFSDFAWPTLFNAATGFEIVARGMGQRCVMAANLFSPALHANRIDWHYGCLATRVVVRKTGPTTLAWPVDPALVSEGHYPH